jgi:hypothetical protein
MPLKLSSKSRSSQSKIDFTVNIIAFKFAPLSFTYAIIIFLKPYSSNNSINFFVEAYPVVALALNNPIVICFGCPSITKELMTKARPSCVPFDHKSKLVVAK